MREDQCRTNLSIVLLKFTSVKHSVECFKQQFSDLNSCSSSCSFRMYLHDRSVIIECSQPPILLSLSSSSALRLLPGSAQVFLRFAAWLLRYLDRSPTGFCLTGLPVRANIVGTYPGDGGSSLYSPEMKWTLHIQEYTFGVQFSWPTAEIQCLPGRIFRETVDETIRASDGATSLSPSKLIQ